MNVDGVGSTDSESFREFGIPSITFHSLTNESLPLLHTKKDVRAAVRFDDYFASAQFLAGYLAYLDAVLAQ